MTLLIMLIPAIVIWLKNLPVVFHTYYRSNSL